MDRAYGSGIFRPEGEAFHKVFFPGDSDPIDLINERCLAQDKSTMGMAGCFSQTYRYLEMDINYLLENLALETELYLWPFSEAMKSARRAYLTPYKALWDQRGGSIGTIEQWTTVLPLL